MLELILYFLALLNPFALFIYMLPLKRELGMAAFLNILVRASFISLGVYIFFAVFGDYFFTEILKLRFESFQIFGGVVLVAMALTFIVQGKESMITIRGELDKIAMEVALPFIVGAGTIALSIVVGNSLGAVNSIFALTVIMTLNALVVTALAYFRQSLADPMKRVLDKNLEILLRINGFIVGAFGIDLIITGISSLLS